MNINNDMSIAEMFHIAINESKRQIDQHLEIKMQQFDQYVETKLREAVEEFTNDNQK